jgi:hypothetical protein
MPWTPELFTWPALQRLLDAREVDKLTRVPYFDGYLTDEPGALIGSFSGEPLVHDPIRGRIRGAAASKTYFAQTHEWLDQHRVAVEDVSRVRLGHDGFGEVVVHFDGPDGRLALPLAIVTARAPDGGIDEIRVYHGTVLLAGRRGARPPLLQPDPELRAPDIVAEYGRALAAGDVDAIVAAFDPDGYVRDATGTKRSRSGEDGLRQHYGDLLESRGIVQADCAIGCQEEACALEYNVVRSGGAELPPQAGMTVLVRGASGRLEAVRIYHDLEAPATTAQH